MVAHGEGVFAIPVADLAFQLIAGEALQGKERPDHVFSRPLGLSFCLGPDPAVDIETRVPPGEKAYRPFGTQKLLADQKRKNPSSEEFSQSRVVDPRDFMEETRLVHPALGHQEMEMGVKIHPAQNGPHTRPGNGRSNEIRGAFSSRPDQCYLSEIEALPLIWVD
jgi:hypothetical protein